jgi:glycosyltransferase involved in cell wall biosynthesis
MHVLIIPSWYPRLAGDAGGSFFREQAIAIAARVNRLGVLSIQLRSLREFTALDREKTGFEVIEDDGTGLLRRNGFNWAPRVPIGISVQWLAQGWRTYLEYRKLYGKPDLIHAHCAVYGGHLAREIAKREGLPYVITEHSTGFARRNLSSYQLRIAGAAFKYAKSRIAVSDSLRETLERQFPGLGLWSTVPNMIDDSFFSVRLRSRSSNGQAFRLLNVALLNPVKRQDLLIRAIHACKQGGGLPIHLSIAGEGSERGRLERLVDLLGLRAQVKFLGMIQRSAMPELMASHDCFVLSSDYETFGVVVAEALACGLRCITTDCGGSAEIVKADDGWTVPVGRVGELANAMQIAAVQDASVTVVQREAVRLRCAERFAARAVCSRILQHYQRALG